MTERTTHTSVEFRHPFRMNGADGLQPAGTYDVQTIEEEIGNLSFVAYRRLSTTIVLDAIVGGMRAWQVTAVDPEDLADALCRDKETSRAAEQI